MRKQFKKILILGSGAIKIGQAGEFDYSGSQAIKALKEEGIKTILVNPNIATIQTSDYLADRVYFLPLEPHFVEGVIKKEKPDGILLNFGGQTALNVGAELAQKGIFEKYKVEVLGTPIEAILNTEDRDLFVKKIREINLKVPTSKAVTKVEEAVKAAEKIGYPVMCRIAYALGGLGSGVAYNKKQLVEMTRKAFSFSKQILIEEYLDSWKEIEYEVVRDNYDNCIVVCTVENIDPMGIHTGESIVVSPVQTLDASECFKLRALAIKVIRHLRIIGECNIQFALEPKSGDYRIIEVNARLSRSSALGSKATGYPLAFIAAKLSLGYSLTEVENIITKETATCFEPALDYVVLKHPRWDLQKFKKVSRIIGSEMKSVGEVMAIGRSFEEVLQKAIRMLDVGMSGLVCNDIKFNNLERELREPTDKRMFAIAEAIRREYSIDKIYELSKVDPWFLYKIRNIVEIEKKLRFYRLKNLPQLLLKEAKQKGFSDPQIAMLTGSNELAVRKRRKKLDIIPRMKQIDTLAAEYPAKTNYLYLTYNGCEDDLDFKGKKQVVVLGGGAYRIGSSVEFDWCCVNSMITLRDLNYSTIMINCNPETVSTDYDICDKLIFDELTFERVLDVCEKEDTFGVIVSMGGQTPNNLALPLHNAGIPILGTSPLSIDKAEDRHKFSQLLDKLGVDQPVWKELTSIREAEKFADKVCYPVLVRPSYVLSGAAMSIALSKGELKEYLKKASEVSKEHPVVISKFITGAKEIEIDAVARQGELYCYAISEHVENAGVHSGDATMVLPPQRTYLETMRRIKTIAKKIAGSLEITGPFNIQFIAKDNDVKVIECNLRASRSFPFVSKVFKINFIDLATKIIMGKRVPRIDRSSFDLDYVGVKAPMFSFNRLKGSDPVLGVEMASTGEVACLGDDFNEAFLKSLISVGFKLPRKTILLSTGPIDSKTEFLKSTRILDELGFKFYATKGTADFIKANDIKAKVLYWPLENKEPNTLSYIASGKIDLVINIPKNIEKEELDNDYLIRRKAVDFNVPLITNLQLAKRFVEAIYKTSLKDLKVKSWDEYN
ncbi:MAG: carbamoyl phosphate synthase large subunit [bacterium (Candidatus Stahlbacteria) CG08_land_8_20_14_0_20_40_26]|nr:MAG: carbamoyl phosphate synthase large subunit [bacterium (Candidatus Stahlbacteria) CG23_combo_of_CG06-09_8_20_14_all_40_9]PIS25202.1 MAG: carbamoyl phosphate synthase large subunit [bacterium (Candidatus Stahlbacteria) CG08_land_8_20_14_0_20_40_26]